MKMIVYDLDLESEGRKPRSDSVTREDFEKLKEIVMAAKHQIEDINAALTEINSALDEQQTALAGVTQDNETNKKLIEQLQASGGAWNDADQKALDSLQANVLTTKDRLKAITEGFKAVDALVPAPVNPNE